MLKETRHKRPHIDSIYVKCLECKSIVTKVDESLPRVRGQEKWKWLLMGTGFLCGVMKMFWN